MQVAIPSWKTNGFSFAKDEDSAALAVSAAALLIAAGDGGVFLGPFGTADLSDRTEE